MGAVVHRQTSFHFGGGCARRIVVLGPAGAGKTTFARRLAANLGVPAVILDELWAAPGVAGDPAAFRSALQDLHAAEGWVSDGNFAAASFDIRLPRAELILWLERPAWLRRLRAVSRALRGDPTHRLADLPKVLAFIRDFDRVNRPKIEAARLAHGADVPQVWLTSDREAEAFLDRQP
jgi:adenylate kinase family enzyme